MGSVRSVKRKYQGNAFMIATLTAAAVTSVVAYGIAKMHSVQMNSLQKVNSFKTAMQFAQDRADVLRATRYNEIGRASCRERV